MITYDDVKERAQEALKDIGKTDDGPLAVIDYSILSFHKRLFVFDKDKNLTDSYLVAHGAGSAANANISKAVFFSNVPNSHCSCLGVFRTGARYVGKNGKSMRLIGLSPTNDNAFSRAIVVHGSKYVSDALAAVPRIGRSWGCPAVAMDKIDEVMDKIEGHPLISIYQ